MESIPDKYTPVLVVDDEPSIRETVRREEVWHAETPQVVRRGLFWPDRNLRLFDRRLARWGGTNPHDKVEVPGGEPVGILIGDYQVQHRPSADHPSDDIPVLQGIAEVAAAAFAPFIAAASPGLFGLDSFGELELPLNQE